MNNYITIDVYYCFILLYFYARIPFRKQCLQENLHLFHRDGHNTNPKNVLAR